MEAKARFQDEKARRKVAEDAVTEAEKLVDRLIRKNLKKIGDKNMEKAKQEKADDRKDLDKKDDKNPKVNPNLMNGALDSCLVGTWRSESGTLGFRLTQEETGGGGILLTIKPDGDTTINYTGMQEIKQVNSFSPTREVLQTSSESGTASGHITTKDGLVTVNGVENSTLTGKLTSKYGTQTTSPSGLRIVFFGGGKAPSRYDLNYACSETELTIRQTFKGESSGAFTFKREKKTP